jgi:hypothetical protein
MAPTTLTRPPVGTGSLPPPGDPDEGGGGGPGWVPLLRAANDIEAHLLAGRLAEAGIEAQMVKDRSAPGAWLYGGANPWAPAIVMVRRLYFDEARIVLAEVFFSAEARPPRAASRERRKAAMIYWSLALGLGFLLTGVALARTTTTFSRCDLPLLCTDPVVQP